MREFLIDSNNNSQRLDKFLFRILPNVSASFVFKMLRKKNITLNDKKASGKEILKIDDVVKIYFSEDTFLKFSSESKVDTVSFSKSIDGISDAIDVVEENDDFIVINKPSGILSQKSKNDDISINEMALAYLYNKGSIDDESIKMYKPSIVNRLDRNTSGLLFFAKTLHGAQYLANAFKSRSLVKLYRCIVDGVIDEAQLIDGYLLKDEKTNKVLITKENIEGAEPIKTEYMPLKDNGKITLLEVHLITGKSHQIRAHLASIGHPIIGDYKYGDKKINDYFKNKYEINNQMLHSYKSILEDGRTYVAEIPQEFQKVIDKEL